MVQADGEDDYNPLEEMIMMSTGHDQDSRP